MTSGETAYVSIALIQVDREARQRRELTGIEELAQSIDKRGLINFPVITRDYKLVAGERRISALKLLGWDQVPIQWADTLDPKELRAIELEENIKRIDIPWQDQCNALLEFHELHVSEEPWNQELTAAAIGLSPGEVAKQLQVARELRDGNALVSSATNLSTAKGIVKRSEERAAQSLRQEVMAVVSEVEKPKLIINADFHTFVAEYAGPPFNLLHCDFPYGIGSDNFDQGGAKSHGGYEDTFKHYQDLLYSLRHFMNKGVAESAHLIFWFSMKHYAFTLDSLYTMGWKVDDFPLIWHRSDNAGILPDPNRGPRRTYETAFFALRGDRKIVRAVSNSFAAATVREQHMSEKPQIMLEHFFRMLVDEHSTVLDPTAGSGSAIRAARALGAKRVLGLELNPEFVERANLALGE